MPTHNSVDRPAEACAAVIDISDIGVDTEFMREKTFFPQLCLVQVATPSRILIVDPLSGEDFAPLWDVLLSRNWIVHSARQDIEVVYQATHRMPASLFDTQVAAALLGFQPQIGYASLARELFGVELPKSHTRANWTARPLPEELLAYAAEDVEYLLPARDVLAEGLDRKGRLAWATADSALLLEPALHALDPAGAGQRLKSLRNLGGARRAAAEALASWRETVAIERNLPRQWIMKDAVLTEIAVRLPSNRSELAGVEDLPPGVLRRAGDEILAAVAAARQTPAPEPQEARRRGAPDALQKSLLKTLQDRVAECAGNLGVAAETIASKKELSAVVVEGERETRLFSGWRKDLIGDQLARML
jgi:ribonuclease D